MPKALAQSDSKMFWRMQFLYWALFYCVFTLLLLSTSTHVDWSIIALPAITVGFAIGFSIALQKIFVLIWDLNLLTRILISVIAISFVSILWSNASILIVERIADSTTTLSVQMVYFGAFYAFISWSAFYHALYFFSLLNSQHDRRMQAESIAVKEQVARLRAETQAKEARLKMLRYQLNPHFLFNSLNATTSLIHKGSNERAKSIIANLSQFLRHALYTNPDVKVSVEQELGLLEMYLDIEKLRFAERLEVSIDCSEECRQALLPSLILQPLVENSMKYAIAPSERGGKISIRVDKSGSTLKVCLIDSSDDEDISNTAIDQRKFFHGKGVGIRNTIDRLTALYEDLHEFSITSTEYGTRVTITIPFELSKDHAST